MRVRNATAGQLEDALSLANERYAGNLKWNSDSGAPCHVAGPRSMLSFRLGVKDCKGPGGRRGYCRNKNGERRRLGGAACWHAHGHFFEALYLVAPQAVVTTAVTRIYGPSKAEGNWIDRQCGSRMDPVRFSRLCDCPLTVTADL